MARASGPSWLGRVRAFAWNTPTMSRPGRFRDYPGHLYGNLALLLGEERAELHDTALRRGASSCHDWAELEKTARKIVESSLSLPTEWGQPRISTDSESWTQGPKSPLHQLSRRYRSCQIILMFGTSSRDIESRREEDTSLLPDDWNWPISIKYLWL